MKVATINEIVGILSGIKILKIADKKVKTTLLNDYIHLRRFVKEADEDRQEIIRKLQEDWKDEIHEVEALVRDGKPVVGHGSYLEAENDARKAIDDRFAIDVDTSVKAVPMDSFVASCAGEELTMEQIAFLQESGVIE